MDDDLRRADAAVVRAKAEVTRAKDEQHRAESTYDIAHLSYQRLFAVSEKKPGLVAQQEIDEAHSKDLVAEAQAVGVALGVGEPKQLPLTGTHCGERRAK